MSNRIHLLLGGGGDIGQALTEKLLARQERVVLAGRPSERLDGASKRFDVPALHLDATRPDEVERVAEEAAGRGEGLASIVNLVGSILLKAAHLTSEEEFESTLRTNLYSAFGTVKAGAKQMRKTGGSIVLLSTAAARLGLPNHEAIAAAKGGVSALAASAAATYSRYDIRVNVVAPGLVETELARPVTQNEASRKASTAMHPLGRLGRPADVASAIAWLLESDAAWVTGQVIGVDGGLSTLKVQR